MSQVIGIAAPERQRGGLALLGAQTLAHDKRLDNLVRRAIAAGNTNKGALAPSPLHVFQAGPYLPVGRVVRY